jgi:hypothetical protein
MHPWVVSTEALVATGWRPQHSNRNALAEMAAEHADLLVVGPLRTRRSHVRAAAAVTAVVALGAAAVVTRRRLRARRG